MSATTGILHKAVAAFLAAASLGISPSFADPIGGGDANIKSMSLNLESAGSTIHVISSDGQKWDRLKAGNIGFHADMDLDTRWPGYTYEVGIVLGACGGPLCKSFPALFYATPGSRDYHHNELISFPTSKIPVSTSGIAILPDGDSIINRCNQHLQPDGPTKSYSFTHDFYMTFVANTGGYINNTDNIIYEAKAGEGPYSVEAVDAARKDSLQINVVCDPVIKAPTNDVSIDHGNFDVKNVKLFLTTYSTLVQGSNPGTVCPQLKVTSRAETNQAGPVSMRIWRQKNGGPITSEFKQAWASYDASKNGYFATYTKWEDVGATSTYQFKTEIVDNADPFAPFDGWKDITVHCTGAGGGGLTTAPTPDPDFPAPQPEWQGQITVADSAGYDKSCPRKGQVSFHVSRAAPGNFNYRIGCSNGASFTGTATGYDQGSGVFEAFGAHDLNINRTRSIQCTLQELQPAPVTVAVDKEDFTCANRTIDPASNDITTTPRPTHGKPEPKLPPVVVDPTPKCLPAQHLVRGRCIDRPIILACKHNEVIVNGKCVKKPKVSILCKPGYRLVGDKCIRKPAIVQACKRGQQRINGRCVKKPDVSILCRKGYRLVGKTCVRIPTLTKRCGSDEKLVRGNCVKAKAAVRPFVAPKRVLKNKPVARTLRQPLHKLHRRQ